MIYNTLSMKKRLVSVVMLIAYSALLIKIMVFKDMPVVRVGSLMLRFGGTESGPTNFVPFKTILSYLLGDKGLLIASINLAGNVMLFIPVGLLLPFIHRAITWKQALALAVAASLVIEGMQTVLQVGIFDIDDVILNALGVMMGYGAFVLFAHLLGSKRYKI